MVQNIKINDYSYQLPNEYIARYPLENRADSRLLIYQKQEITEQYFRDLPSILPPNSLLVRNNSKVIHARLLFQRATGATIEIFCLEPLKPASYELSLQSTTCCVWACMLGNAKRWKIGDERLKRQLSSSSLGNVTLSAERIDQNHVCFSWDNPSYSFASILEAMGVLPIPPYLDRETEPSDERTYQTIYADREGSVAAPTAGLHFTEEIFRTLHNKAINIANVTLHVGAGTFKPVKTETIGEHQMHREFVSIDLDLLYTLQKSLGHIIAVGTTSVRTLESLYHLALRLVENKDISESDLLVEQWSPYNLTESNELTSHEALQILIDYMVGKKIKHLSFPTSIIIVPGYKFRLVCGLITNFHQPNSTLLLLIAAFVGNDWRRIYDYALKERFRFLSYGDSSILLP